MPKLTPPDSVQQTLPERLGDPPWQSWIFRLFPMLYMTTLTLVLPTILTQSFVVSDLGVTQEQKLRQQLRSISIEILARGESIGSGVLLRKQDRVYTVVTNAHVIQSTKAPFQLQTHDGEIYAAALVAPPTNQNRDLSILRFRSERRAYATAKLATASPKVGERVWSAGFPADKNTGVDRAGNDTAKAAWGLEIVSGQVTQILPIAISGGYGIGFDPCIRKGMSGGPVLNRAGELVGINGLHANPLWDAPEVLENGSTVSDVLQEQIKNSSWAIPSRFIRDYTKL
jgi:S1-C subfamily serine protease